MRINWKLRFKNPVFWAHLAVSVILPILTCFGLNFEQMTTWGALGSLLVEAIKNPVVVVAVIVSVWNFIVDPTTKGISDSTRALSYDKPN